MYNGIKGVTKTRVLKVEPQQPINGLNTEVSDGIQEPPSMIDIMKPITRSMTVFGIYFWKKKRKIHDHADGYSRAGTCALFSSTIIYNIIVVLVLCWGLLRLLVSMIIGGLSTGILIYHILSFSWDFLCAVNGVVCLKSSTNRFGHLHVFYQHWQEKVTKDFRELKIQYNTTKLRRGFFITFTISWMVIAFNVVGTGILLFAPLGEVSDTFGLLFTSPFPTTIPLKILSLIIHCYITCAWILPAPLVIISSLAIKYGFLALCDAMEREISLSNDKLTDRLQEFRKAHLNLCRCIDILDKDINILNANWYAVNVPLTCFILYALINFGDGILAKAMLTFWLVTTLGYVAMTSFFAANLHEMAHSLLEPILETATNDITLEKHAQLNLILVKLNGPSIGFTVLTLITITKELLLTVTCLSVLFCLYLLLLNYFLIIFSACVYVCMIVWFILYAFCI
ncbi:hypothetical protein ACJMK2_044644 [Sinanodonta woodiana]|uniref:Odorant receptor n=1 Tax=Sinanodonta woodiana TaxID=1069815 RepID=A0ABD3W3W1_SINWO